MRDEERDRKMAIATTILQQLGGHKFVVMTGAKDCLALDSGLRFRLPGGAGYCKQGINRVEIELAPNDTYNVSFSRVRKTERLDLQIKTIAEHFDIYCDQLQDIFTAETGLDTHL